MVLLEQTEGLSLSLCSRCSLSPSADVGAHQRARVSVCQSVPPPFLLSTWRFTCVARCSEAPSSSPAVHASHNRTVHHRHTEPQVQHRVPSYSTWSDVGLSGAQRAQTTPETSPQSFLSLYTSVTDRSHHQPSPPTFNILPHPSMLISKHDFKWQ